MTELVYAEDGVDKLPGSRWQVVLNEDRSDYRPDNTVYFHVNHRNGDVFTVDINDEQGLLDLVIQVSQRDLLHIAHMFLSAAMR